MDTYPSSPIEIIPEKSLAPTRSKRVARMVSNTFCPPVLAVVSTLLAAFQLTTLAGWLWSGFMLLSGILAPLGFIIYQCKRGKVSDFEIYNREQRKGSYLFTMLIGSITLLVMWLFAAPLLLVAIGTAAVLQVAVMFLINTRWKISAHAASMAVFVTLLLFMFGRAMLPATAGIPLMIWSRVSLRRHTLLQTLAGTCLGIAIFVTCLMVIIP